MCGVLVAFPVIEGYQLIMNQSFLSFRLLLEEITAYLVITGIVVHSVCTY